MTIELTDQEIEAIAFAHSHLELKLMMNPKLPPKTLAYQTKQKDVLGKLVDRLEDEQKETRIIGTARAE